jgi:hypothetical protein
LLDELALFVGYLGFEFLLDAGDVVSNFVLPHLHPLSGKIEMLLNRFVHKVPVVLLHQLVPDHLRVTFNVGQKLDQEACIHVFELNSKVALISKLLELLYLSVQCFLLYIEHVEPRFVHVLDC